MRILVTGLLILLGCELVNSQNDNSRSISEMKLKSVHQMIMSDTLNFDFSGIVQKEDSIFVVADKPWNTYIYSIGFADDGWFVKNKRKISSKERFDLEAIDYSKGVYYLANEFTGSINKLDANKKDLQILPINFEENGLQPHTWGNAGWEGLAIDPDKQLMYLLKERQPRMIYVIEMNNWTIIDQYDIPQDDSNDFSDAKFLGGYLYVLERNGNYVTKIDPTTKKVISKFHYRHVASHPKGKLYEPEKYGMAEALLITKDEIWVGLDNNGLEASEYAQQTFNFKAKAPAILKFERPKDF